MNKYSDIENFKGSKEQYEKKYGIKDENKKKVAKKMTRGEYFDKQQHEIEKKRWNGKTSKHDYSK